MSNASFIVGTGLVSCLGIGKSETYRAMLERRCGIRPLTRFPVEAYDPKHGGQLEAAAEDALRSEFGDSDLALCMIKKAAAEALGTTPTPAVPDAGLGLVLSSNFGLMETREWCWRERIDTNEMDADTFRLQQDVVRHVAEALGVAGPAVHISLSCASGPAGVKVATEWLRNDRVDRVMAIAYDALTEFCWCGLTNMRTITAGRLQPFDRQRSGTIFGEGAAAMLLAADADDKRTLGAVTGAATNNNAFHLTAPARNGDGSRRVMESALASSGRTAEAVGFISAHATATTANDATECAAIRAVTAGLEIPVAGFKSNFGHLLGAAGLAEMVISLECMNNGKIPPVLHLDDQDPACNIDCVKDNVRRGAFVSALTNSAGIGGNNAATLLERCPPRAPLTPPVHAAVAIRAAGWVLPDHVGGSRELPSLDADRLLDATGDVGDFSVKPLLQSVKGYLDKAAEFALGSAALCLRVDSTLTPNWDSFGVVGATQYGAPRSGFEFFRQMVTKGPRLASPMIFPHGYSNTPANLVAIEFGMAGPHMVFDHCADAGEPYWYAANCIRMGEAENMLVLFFEATDDVVLPDGYKPLNGALCLWLTAAADGSPATDVAASVAPAPWRATEPASAKGALYSALRMLASTIE